MNNNNLKQIYDLLRIDDSETVNSSKQAVIESITAPQKRKPFRFTAILICAAVLFAATVTGFVAVTERMSKVTIQLDAQAENAEIPVPEKIYNDDGELPFDAEGAFVIRFEADKDRYYTISEEVRADMTNYMMPEDFKGGNTYDYAKTFPTYEDAQAYLGIKLVSSPLLSEHSIKSNREPVTAEMVSWVRSENDSANEKICVAARYKYKKFHASCRAEIPLTKGAVKDIIGIYGADGSHDIMSTYDYTSEVNGLETKILLRRIDSTNDDPGIGNSTNLDFFTYFMVDNISYTYLTSFYSAYSSAVNEEYIESFIAEKLGEVHTLIDSMVIPE